MGGVLSRGRSPTRRGVPATRAFDDDEIGGAATVSPTGPVTEQPRPRPPANPIRVEKERYGSLGSELATVFRWKLSL